MTESRRPHKYPNTLVYSSNADVVFFRCAARGEWVDDNTTVAYGCPVDWRARERVGELQANYDELHNELVAALYRVATLESLLAETRQALSAYEADREASDD